jgi:hypothetical protein
LWIDSLCIIHDDADDGKCEASKMAECYQNAVVTLSATDAMTCLGLQVGSLASSPSFGDFASAATPPRSPLSAAFSVLTQLTHVTWIKRQVGLLGIFTVTAIAASFIPQVASILMEFFMGSTVQDRGVTSISGVNKWRNRDFCMEGCGIAEVTIGILQT